MSNNIISEYIEFLRKAYLELFKIVFKNKYRKELVIEFINRYIDVRYYNETNYPAIKDFMDRINKELILVLDSIATDDNIELLKNYVALFGYLVYFDDVCYVSQEGELLNLIVNDNIVKIDNKDALKEELKEWLLRLKRGKDNFNNAIFTKDFNLLEKRVYRKLYSLTLEHDIKISNLFSEYAIEKAYNTGIVNEDKSLITYILASYVVLNNAINLDFSRRYMVNFVSSLFQKEKKLARLMNIINNTLAKKYISIKITYEDYVNNKEVINKYINEGYFFVLELDSSYNGNITELVLFPFILVEEDSEEYELLMKEKDNIKSKIIKL